MAFDNGQNEGKLWNGILAGKDKGILPVGLGQEIPCVLLRAPLRSELSDSITPLEAGLKPFVKLNKDSFIGKEALASRYEKGLDRKLYGFEMVDRGIPRNGYEVVKEGRKIGYVTSGGPLPSLGKNGGLALLDDTGLFSGETIEIMIRDRICEAKIVSTPFYGKRYKK